MNDWWSRLVVELNCFHFSCLLKWNSISAAGLKWKSWNGIYQLKWNFRDQHLGKRWIYGRSSRPIHLKNTIQKHGIRAGRAGRAGSRAHRRARHPAELEIACWNGIFISAQQLKWNFHVSKQDRPSVWHFMVNKYLE
jgi:hypothetical protein